MKDSYLADLADLAAARRGRLATFDRALAERRPECSSLVAANPEVSLEATDGIEASYADSVLNGANPC